MVTFESTGLVNTDETLKMEFIDNGIEFNPLLKEDVNLPFLRRVYESV